MEDFAAINIEQIPEDQISFFNENWFKEDLNNNLIEVDNENFIPCEECNLCIPFEFYKAHSDSHKTHIKEEEEKKNTTASIPCDICQLEIPFNEYEKHIEAHKSANNDSASDRSYKKISKLGDADPVISEKPPSELVNHVKISAFISQHKANKRLEKMSIKTGKKPFSIFSKMPSMIPKHLEIPKNPLPIPINSIEKHIVQDDLPSTHVCLPQNFTLPDKSLVSTIQHCDDPFHPQNSSPLSKKVDNTFSVFSDLPSASIYNDPHKSCNKLVDNIGSLNFPGIYKKRVHRIF